MKDNQKEMRFRAIISDNTIIDFTFQDLIEKYKLFSFREILIPRLAKWNNPELL